MKNLIAGKNTGKFVILSLRRDEKRIDRIIHHSEVKKEEGTATGIDRVRSQFALGSQMVEVFLEIISREKLKISVEKLRETT